MSDKTYTVLFSKLLLTKLFIIMFQGKSNNNTNFDE